MVARIQLQVKSFFSMSFLATPKEAAPGLFLQDEKLSVGQSLPGLPPQGPDLCRLSRDMQGRESQETWSLAQFSQFCGTGICETQ